jgi:hypothetical protein
MPSTDEVKAVYSRLSGEFGEGRVHLLEAAGESFIVRGAGRESYRRFKSYALDPQKRPMAYEALLTDTVLWPAAQEREAIFDVKPGLVEAIGEYVATLSGAGASVEKKAP